VNWRLNWRRRSELRTRRNNTEAFMFEQAFKNIDDVLWKSRVHHRTGLHGADLLAPLPEYLDALELDKADEAALDGRKYAFILDKPYRWDEWAAPKAKDGQIDHNRAATAMTSATSSTRSSSPTCTPSSKRPQDPIHRIQDRRDLRRDQEQDLQRLQPARDHQPHRRASLPFPDRKARVVPSLRGQDQEHGQRRA